MRCRGYLFKQGGMRKNWKRRWFQLGFENEGHIMAYWQSADDAMRRKPVGVIDLTGATVTDEGQGFRDHKNKQINECYEFSIAVRFAQAYDQVAAL